MIYVYPVFIQPATEGGYSVRIPDFDQYTQGDTIGESMMMARDCIGSLALCYEDAGKTVPEPYTSEIVAETNETLFMIDIDFEDYKAQYDNQMVKKNCTIPRYLERAAEKKGLNFSRVLAEALAQILMIER